MSEVKPKIQDKIVESLVNFLISKVASKEYRSYLTVAMMVGSMVMKETAHYKSPDTFNALLDSARDYHLNQESR